MKEYTENQKAILNVLLLVQKEIPTDKFVKKSIAEIIDSAAAPIKNGGVVCQFIIRHFLEKGGFCNYKWIGGNPTIYSAIKIEKESRTRMALAKRKSVKKLANELITIKADNAVEKLAKHIEPPQPKFIRKDGKTKTEPAKKYWKPVGTPKAKKLKIVEETVLFWGLYRRTRLV